MPSSEARPHTFPVSWDELHRDTKALAWRLAELPAFTSIIAIASYDERTQGRAQILKRVGGEGRGVLVVDDLVDTGITARLVREMLPEAHIATVYAKPAGRPDVDTFVTVVSQDTWILFPWDVGDPVKAGG